MLNVKVSNQTRSGASKNKVVIKRESNQSYVLECYKKAHYKKVP